MPDMDFLAAVQRSEGFRTHILPRLDAQQLEALNAHFPTYAQSGQVPPIDGWRTWLIKAGRGYGKTRAGAEWVWSLVRAQDEPSDPFVSSEDERPLRGARTMGVSSSLDTNGEREFSANGNIAGSPQPLHIALVGATIDEARRV